MRKGTSADWHHAAAEDSLVGKERSRYTIEDKTDWIESIFMRILEIHATQIRVTIR